MKKNTNQEQLASGIKREQIEGSYRARYDISRHAKTARTVAVDHAKEALIWIWNWTMTDVATIALILRSSHSSASRVIARLLRQGLIAKLPLEGVPTMVYHMTSIGAQVTQGFIQNKSPHPPVAASRIWIKNAQHDLICARIVAQLIHHWRDMPAIAKLCDTARRQGMYTDDMDEISLSYRSSRACREEDQLQKKYDALITIEPMSMMIGIEVQQTYENDILRAVALSRIAVDMQRGTPYGCIYTSTNPSILAEYKSGFGPQLKRWKRNKGNHYIEDQTQPSPFADWMADRLILLPRPDLERVYYTSISLR